MATPLNLYFPQDKPVEFFPNAIDIDAFDHRINIEELTVDQVFELQAQLREP